MKAISLKAQTMPQIVTAGRPWGTVINRVKRLKKYSLHIAVVSAVAAFFGCLIDSDLILFAGTLSAIAAIYPETATKEGGEK